MFSKGAASSLTHRCLTLGGGLVLLALLLQALSLFHGAQHFAASLTDSDSVVEICTPAGIIRISTTPGDQQDPELSIQTCPYCWGAQFTALPSPGPLQPCLTVTFLHVSPVGKSRPPRAPDQRHAPPRGPPLLT